MIMPDLLCMIMSLIYYVCMIMPDLLYIIGTISINQIIIHNKSGIIIYDL